MPAAVADDGEVSVVLRASLDGESMVQLSAHVYVRSVWMRAAYPEQAETLDAIERRVREAASTAASGAPHAESPRGTNHDPAY